MEIPEIPKLPDQTHAPVVLGGVLGVFEPAGGLGPLQQAVFDAVSHRLYGIEPGDASVTPLPERTLLAPEVGDEVRHQVLYLAVVLEQVAHPLDPAAARAVTAAAHALGVDLAAVRAARLRAEGHLLRLRADLRRHSWYAERTAEEVRHGHLIELVRSKLAYEGGPTDAAIAARWRGLRDCPAGSWGRGVADFYERHGFPFPGERHGIYEVGAIHDFVHVLADYDATPDGEIDVFAFIAATMPAHEGLVMLAVTLGMFQTGSIHRVEGKVVRIGRVDALSEEGAVERFADALDRGRACTVDVFADVDHFALAPDPLDAVRARFAIPPRLP